MNVVGIGVDLVRISRMREVLDRWQERFLARVFTEQEIAYCRRRRDPVPHFAARFAAKEAGLKALGTGLRLGISWRELEVQRERGAAPRLVLSGRSREIGLRRVTDPPDTIGVSAGDASTRPARCGRSAGRTAPPAW